MLYARPDEGIASRKLNPTDKSYEQRIDEAFEVICMNPDFDVVDDEDMGLVFISYHDPRVMTKIQLCVLSNQFSAMENWLMLKVVSQLAFYTMEV